MRLCDFIRYYGTKSFFAGLLQDENNRYLILYGKIQYAEIFQDELCFNYNLTLLERCKKEATIQIPFKTDKNGALFHIMQLHNEAEFDTIVKILETVI